MTTTHYIDGFQYNGNTMDFFPTAEGYVKVTHSSGGGIGGGAITYNYVFNYTDHLGNIRLRYAINPANQWLEILEEDHYYPFGLKHKGYNAENYVFIAITNGPVQLVPTNPNVLETYKYKFNGIEYQDELQLNMYSMDLRHYDPAIARWVVQDPITHFDYSPYSAFDNNPVFWADPSGADATSLIQELWDATPENGTSTWTNSNSDDNEDEQEQPKYQFYGITPTGDLMNLNFDGNFRVLTGFGEDPEDLRKYKASTLSKLLKTLSIEDKVKLFRFLKIPSKHWVGLLKSLKMGPSSIMPNYDVHDEGLAALGVLGALFQPLNNDRDSGGRLIENMNMWDAVRGGYNSLMSTGILNDVIIIYSNVNLYNQSTINTNEAEALDSRHPTGSYKYAYYGTQYGGSLYIFGSYEINN